MRYDSISSSVDFDNDKNDSPEEEDDGGGGAAGAATNLLGGCRDEESAGLLRRREAPASPGRTESRGDEPRRRRSEKSGAFLLRSRARRWLFASLSLAAASAALVCYCLPTSRELRLAGDYDLSWLDLPRLRAAQSLALESASFLNADAAWEDGRTVVHKITRDKSASSSRSYMNPPEGCESTVVIIRHCEKGSVREHCAHIGFERAVYLATQFGFDKSERWPAPSFIFAEGPGQRRSQRKMNFREMETVGPLADKVGVKVDDSYSTETVNDLAREIMTVLQSGQMYVLTCGKVTLISWKHSNIGHLAHRLGCGPEQGCPMDYKGASFDMAWQIKFTYQRPEHSSRKDLQVSPEPLWNIAGSVQPEGFDPLSFSKQSGDYPRDGTPHGARWRSSAVSYPERKRRSHTQWKATRVGFHGGSRSASSGGDGHHRNDERLRRP